MTAETAPIRGDPSVTDLVTRARSDDKQAWDALVERYAPLVWSICRSCRIGGADAEDVSQNVWLQLVDQLDRIRGRPRFLPGSPPPPAGMLGGSSAQRGGRTLADACWTQRTSRTSRPGWPSRMCSWPSATQRCARRSPICRPGCQQLIALLIEGPSHSLRRHQRQAGHPGWQHRAAAPAAWPSCAATRPSPL